MMERKVRYVQEGNTLREVYDFPARQPKEKEHTSERVHKRTYYEVEKAPRMSLKMTVLLAASVVLSVMSCIKYLNVQADINEVKNDITKLEKNIDVLSTKNASVAYEIDSYVDVEYVMKTAIEELGMVMADEEQVITYESTRNEYMEQYGDVPKN